MRRLRSLMVAALLVAAGPATAEAPPEQELVLGYLVYVGGFEVLSLDVGIGLDPDAYDMAIDISTRGMIGRMFPWNMKAYSRGRLDNGRIAPESAGQRNQWRDRKRWVQMRFVNGTPILESAEPPPEDGQDVSEQARAGAFDVASAVLLMARTFNGAPTCDGRFPIYDGRRRYDITAAHLGVETFERGPYSAYEGRALRCSLELERIEGFTRSRFTGDQYSADLWMGQPFANLPPIPVRLELDTRWGALRAHVARIALRKADGTQEIKRKR